jgi:Bacterial Ig-like domain
MLLIKKFKWEKTMSSNRVFAAIWLIAFLLMVSCNDGTSSSDGTCSNDNDCDGGICVDGVCETAVDDKDSGIDAGGGDADTDADSDSDTDTIPDAGDTLTFSDYPMCSLDEDCPSGYGDCILEIPLNIEDRETGQTSVLVEDLFPSLSQPGLCTKTCTDKESVCDSLELKDFKGTSVKYECQLVFGGTHPYPSPVPEFPFDDQLDGGVLNLGVPFGAICRPPFGLDDSISSSFCSGCGSSSECSDGLCWNFGEDREPIGKETGLCLTGCDGTNACPVGFDCDTFGEPSPIGSFCRPIQDTCNACRDLDKDGFGLGHCGSDGKTSFAIDCDDYNVSAYFDSENMNHPFPAHCGEHDYNCNGISDELEQIGADVFGADHCGACYSECQGEFVQEDGGVGAANVCQSEDSVISCVIGCTYPLEYADCDNLIENGCETPADDILFFFDSDGDGEGDLNEMLVLCEGDMPEGYVTNSDDCDDTNPAAEGSICDTLSPGICAGGTWKCVQTEAIFNLECVPNNEKVDIDLCNGADDNCNGQTDEDVVSIACDVMGATGECAKGSESCIDGTLVCESFEQKAEIIGDGLDFNCDGFDGIAAKGVFAAPGSPGLGNGTMDAPFSSVQEAIDLAAFTKRDVYVASGTIELTESLILSNEVSIYGGFRRYASDPWSLEMVEIEGSMVVVSRTDFLTDRDAMDGDDVIIGFDGKDLTRSTWLKNISIHTAKPSTSGVSVYGVRCNNCPEFKLENIEVHMSNATDGAYNGGSNGTGESALFDASENLWVASDGAGGVSGEAGGSSIGMMFFNHANNLFAKQNNIEGASNVTVFMAGAGDGGGSSAGGGGAGGDSLGVLHGANIRKIGFFIDETRAVLGAGGAPIGELGVLEPWQSFNRCVVYVDDTALGTGDGSSWTNAILTVQAGILKAKDGDPATSSKQCDVWVAQGRYTPGSQRADTFVMASGVGMYGGFTGAETSIYERTDIIANATILSGDLLNDDTPGDFVTNRGENAYNVVTGVDNSVLDGFIISGGHANVGTGHALRTGGGMNNYQKSPEIRNCLFRDNYALYGSAMYNYICPNVEVANSVFVSNEANDDVTLHNNTSAMTCINCTFADNEDTNSGVAISSSLELTVSNSIILGEGGALIVSNPLITSVTYSNVQGGYDGIGNIDELSLFEDEASGDFSLQLTSPCVEAGNYGAVVEYGIESDITGKPRFVGDRVDMGAFERQDVTDTRPTVIQVNAMTPNSVEVVFDQPMDRGTSTAVPNYVINSGISIASARQSQNRTSVILTTSTMSICTEYSIVIDDDVEDVLGNTMASDVATTFEADALLFSDFYDGTMAGWSVVDEGLVEPPSNWVVTKGQLRQTSNIRSGGVFPRYGTYSYWNDTEALTWTDYTLSLLIRNNDNDGIGVMFRYQDPDNYYKLEMDVQADFIRLTKMLAGVETELATITAVGFEEYVANQTFEIKIEVATNQIDVYQDDILIIGPVVDDDADAGVGSDLENGSVALYSWGNTNVDFDDVSVKVSCQ